MASAILDFEEPWKEICPHPLQQTSNPHDQAFPVAQELEKLRIDGQLGEFPYAAEIDRALSQRAEVSCTDMAQTLQAQSAQQRAEGDVSIVSELDDLTPSAGPRTSGGRASSPKQDQNYVDHKSITQALFNTTAWNLGSVIERRNGMDGYRLARALKLNDSVASDQQGASSIIPATHTADRGDNGEPMPRGFWHRVEEDRPRTIFKKGDWISHVVGRSQWLGYSSSDPRPLRWSFRLCPKHAELQNRGTLKYLSPQVIHTMYNMRCVQFGASHPQPYNTFYHRSQRFHLLSRRWQASECRNNHANQGEFLVLSDPSFAHRSIAYVLSSPTALLMSFHQSETSQGSLVSHQCLILCFAELLTFETTTRLVYPSLWHALGAAYLQHGSQDNDEVLSDKQAADLTVIALCGLVARTTSHHFLLFNWMWSSFVRTRQEGGFSIGKEVRTKEARDYIAGCIEAYQDELAMRLMRRVLRVFASRTYRIRRHADGDTPQTSRDHSSYLTNVFFHFSANSSSSESDASSTYGVPPGAKILEWARLILYDSWSGQAEFGWSSDAGAALEFITVLYEHRTLLQIPAEDFEMPYIFRRLDFMQVPLEWANFRSSLERAHLLSFPWLFSRSSIVTFFRALNFATMAKAFEAALTLSSLVSRMGFITGPRQRELFNKLATAQSSFLVLEIRRESILDDALNQLWRRQKKELYRPLKVRMGMMEGEEGVDLGGVQQEFFRLALGQALDPSYGLFSVDPETQMSWFLPCSKVPLHQFVLVGLLVGLAVYNGITLPVTLPMALYRKLLDIRVDSLEHIEDGWPGLAKGFTALLTWSEGDVEDVFMRSYIFSANVYGAQYAIDMHSDLEKPWPPEPNVDPTDTAPMVNNENREDFVRDYISWLTDQSIRPQYNAFATGFFLPLDKSSLRQFSPEALQALVEGVQEIDIAKLEQVTNYENGFSAGHQTIRDFWSIVRSFSPAELRQLLEFVTASDRIPVRGVEEIMFSIQRNGATDERLPTSLTCFGRLLLPDYPTKQKMEEKLRLALENSRGFGVA